MNNVIMSVVSTILTNPVLFLFLALLIILLVAMDKRTKTIEAVRESHKRRAMLVQQQSYEHLQPTMVTRNDY